MLQLILALSYEVETALKKQTMNHIYKWYSKCQPLNF